MFVELELYAEDERLCLLLRVIVMNVVTPSMYRKNNSKKNRKDSMVRTVLLLKNDVFTIAFSFLILVYTKTICSFPTFLRSSHFYERKISLESKYQSVLAWVCHLLRTDSYSTSKVLPMLFSLLR